MAHPILERHLTQGALKPVYLFYGDEDFLMRRAIKRLEQGLAEKAGEAPRRVVLESQEVELSEFLAQARVAPLWGPGQILVLRRPEAYSGAQLKALEAYLENPPRRAWVVLLSEGLKTRDVEKNRVFSRLLKDEAALGFYRLKERELHQWLAQEARALGKTLPLGAAQLLVEMAGDNLQELTRELEKLALFAGKESTLSPALVGQLASHSRTYNIFALVDALGKPKSLEGLAALSHLLDLGEAPPKILTMLARQVRLLIRVKESPPDAPPDTLARALEVPGGVVRKLAAQARQFSLTELNQHLWRLHLADRQLKTSTAVPRAWLEWVLLEMGGRVKN
jgi:DNA polymerase-3 subunit delta